MTGYRAQLGVLFEVLRLPRCTPDIPVYLGT